MRIRTGCSFAASGPDERSGPRRGSPEAMPIRGGRIRASRVRASRIRASRIPLLLAALAASALGLGATLPGSAGAYATVAGPPDFSSAPGLPDGRVYEEVSPPNKNGGEAGARGYEGLGAYQGESLSTADGNSIFFGGFGGFGEAVSGIDNFYVAQRSLSGWSTKSALPRPPGTEGGPEGVPIAVVNDMPLMLAPSSDLSHTVFSASVPYVPAAYSPHQFGFLFLAGSNPLVAPSWITRPVGAEVAVPFGSSQNQVIPVGGSSNFNTVYFTDGGTLGLPQDASRAPHAAEEDGLEGSDAWGFYQYGNGVLSEAGVLPDGSLSPFGAVPAALAGMGVRRPARFPNVGQLDNEVSSDGSRAFFVSPDPRASSSSPLQQCLGHSQCTTTVPQLYVRETASTGTQSTVLVSQSQLPGHVGQQAPDGPVAIPNAVPTGGSSFVYGSPDGSQAFFASTDQLTNDAPATTTVELAGGGVAGGSFTLTVDVDGVSETTTSLPYGASSAEVLSALEALGNVGAGHAAVVGGRITFSGLEPAPVAVTANPQTFGFSLPKVDTFTLTVEVGGVSETTPAIADGASTAEVQSALETLGNVGAGNVTVATATGGGSITFAESLVSAGLVLTGSEGANLQPTLDPRTFGYTPDFTLTVGVDGVSKTTAPIAYAASAAQIQSALEALENVGPGNVSNVTVEAVNNSGSITFTPSLAGDKLSLTGNGTAIDEPDIAATDSAPVKYYDFNVDTGVLAYLPDVAGSIVAAASDGSSFVFEDTATSPADLDRWSAGPGGGTVTQIAPLPGSPPVQEGRTSADGSVDVFATGAPIAGFNDGNGFEQIFRYDARSDTLSCVSCPPAGVTPSGNAVLSNLAEQEIFEASGTGNRFGMVDDRGVSADGSKVFFDTPDPLVSQDIDGKDDVYEWEHGTVFLISSGTSESPSLVLDSSSDGSDVFFATVDGLAPGDTEGGYDVYDARIPHPGDNPPPAAVPCQGDVCQGPPSVPSLLGAPSSETFNGLGNIAQAEGPKPAVKATKVKKKPKPKARHRPKKRKQTKKSSSKKKGNR